MILAYRRSSRFPGTTKILNCFASQRIVIGSAKSGSFDLKFGVPQGSCLGLMLFSLNTSELFDVISQHLPTAHSYADDTGISLAFNPNDDSDQDAAIAAMEALSLIHI